MFREQVPYLYIHSLHIYAPLKTSRKSCLLSNSETFGDIFMKLVQCKIIVRPCAEKNCNHLHSLQNYAPLKISPWKSCSLNNSETLRDIFLKFGTNIKYHRTIFREQLFTFVYGIVSLCKFSKEIMITQ